MAAALSLSLAAASAVQLVSPEASSIALIASEYTAADDIGGCPSFRGKHNSPWRSGAPAPAGTLGGSRTPASGAARSLRETRPARRRTWNLTNGHGWEAAEGVRFVPAADVEAAAAARAVLTGLLLLSPDNAAVAAIAGEYVASDAIGGFASFKSKHNGFAVWHSGPSWYVGRQQHAGERLGTLSARSAARTPDRVRAWRDVSADGQRWEAAPGVKFVAGAAAQAERHAAGAGSRGTRAGTVLLTGATNNSMAKQLLGVPAPFCSRAPHKQ